MTFLSHSIFNGLRCGPLGLQTLLLAYCKLDLASSPSVVDLVQNAGYGDSCVRHFISALRALESEAGFNICKSQKLRTKVEVDATNLLTFHVSRHNTHYSEAIRSLERRLEKKGESIDNVYVAHVQVLGAVQRGGAPVVHVCEPVVTQKGVMLVYCLSLKSFPFLI